MSKKYHYQIKVNTDRLEENLARIAFRSKSDDYLYFDTNTRLVKGELLEAPVRDFSITLEITKISRYNIKCDDGMTLADVFPQSKEPTDEVWFFCKADAFIDLDQ